MSEFQHPWRAHHELQGTRKNLKQEEKSVRSCSIKINRFRLVGLVELFRVQLAKNRFPLVWLLVQLFQPASNWVETVEKALVAAAVVFAGSKNCYVRVTSVISPRTRRLHGSLIMTIPRSDRVSTENGWKSALLENVNCVNRNHFRLKRLSPTEHDLSFPGFLCENCFPFFIRVRMQ